MSIKEILQYALVFLPIVALVEGAGLSLLWAWFIVPTFGLPALTITRAIGIALLVTTLFGQTLVGAQHHFAQKTRIVILDISIRVGGALLWGLLLYRVVPGIPSFFSLPAK